jgi:AcrR family transcriptional regulator
MASVTAPTARSPRLRLDVEERREAILEAARGLYATTGYAAVSVGQIAERAGSSTALVFHYFGSKANLYATVVEGAITDLVEAQRAADAQLSPGVSARDRVRTSLLVYLDHVASHPDSWAAPLRGGEEPREALEVRHRARSAYVDRLRQLLQPATWARHEFALWGYFGFLDQACLHWVDAGCPDEERHALIEAALGALEGALGDWGR